MDLPRLILGAASERGIRLRLDGWASPASPLRIEPLVTGREHVASMQPVDPTGEGETWIADVAGLEPETLYTIGLQPPLADPGNEGLVRTPPRALSDRHALLFALASCYFPSEEYVGRAARVRDCLHIRGAQDFRRSVPHLKFLCGDQIYADVPAAPPSQSPEGLYRERYERAWGADRLGSLLAWGANAFACDDHEFWNGFPDEMFWLSRTRGGSWFRWAQVAAEACWRNQGIWNFAPGFTGGEIWSRGWFSGRLAGIDIFVADTRTDRMSRNKRRCPANTAGGQCPPVAARSALSQIQRDALLRWANAVQRIGLLVLGQPLLAQASRWSDFDSTLPEYEEYGSLFAVLRENIIQRGISFIILSGDIHWGRLVSWRSPFSTRAEAKLVEFVASPIARVGRKNILSSKLSVGKKLDVAINLESFPDFSRELPGFTGEKLFATNENNFGLLELTEPEPGQVLASFELWSLDARDIARNLWVDGQCRSWLTL